MVLRSLPQWIWRCFCLLYIPFWLWVMWIPRWLRSCGRKCFTGLLVGGLWVQFRFPELTNRLGETFNRIITRKKYLCRSRAVQINLNLSELEDWIGEVGLPGGIQSHFVPVRDLLNWLQVCWNYPYELRAQTDGEIVLIFDYGVSWPGGDNPIYERNQSFASECFKIVV